MSESNATVPTPKRDSSPRLFDLSNPEHAAEFERLRASGDIRQVIDEYKSQLTELFAVENPHIALSPEFPEKLKKYIGETENAAALETQGKWAYFPWQFSAVHILNDEAFQRVRTARNRNLITEEEQKKFYNCVIGIAGLSVGNSVALAIALQGGARRIKLADHDSLELSNLNRIRSGVDSLGIPKVEITARQIYLLNPYAEIEIFPEGLTEETIEPFFKDLDIVIDEIDSLLMKFRIREEAKKRKLPVIMAADNDASGVLDIDRYDIEAELPFFHGRLKNTSKEEVARLDKRAIGAMIAQLIGLENHTERMLSSLNEMGRSVVSWPQRGGTALLNGAVAAYAALRIANKQTLIDNRSIVALDALLDGDYDSEPNKNKRAEVVAEFRKKLGL